MGYLDSFFFQLAGDAFSREVTADDELKLLILLRYGYEIFDVDAVLSKNTADFGNGTGTIVDNSREAGSTLFKAHDFNKGFKYIGLGDDTDYNSGIIDYRQTAALGLLEEKSRL